MRLSIDLIPLLLVDEQIFLFFRPNTPVTVTIENPEWDSQEWSKYPNLDSIELLYRFVGDDAQFNRISFPLSPPAVCAFICSLIQELIVFIKGQKDFGFGSARWLPVGLNDGEYELILHVICEPSGLSFPPMGIDEYYSSTVKGVCSLN